ncbi:MAG: electron transport complex subunit RsxC [Planctomycetota bacterium]
MSYRSFPGGVHPPEQKMLARAAEIVDLPAPALVSVPVSQHIGAPSKPCVAVGVRVLRGQMVAESAGFVSVPQHAPVSGTVKAIEPVPGLFGAKVMAVVIENDGKDESVETWGKAVSLEGLTPKDIIGRVLSAGLVGMGGATFPTHVKLSPPADFPIDTLILNGAECEPYLTCDYRLMLAETAGILAGCKVLMQAVNCKRAIIAIEDNKPDCVAAFQAANTDPRIEVVELPVKYPQGAEKQLIYALLGRKVPTGGLPMAVNTLVHNVGTAFAAYNAVCRGIPLVDRVLTVTGEGVEAPGNFRVRVGTPVKALLDYCHLKPGANKLILGGPMMGLAQRSDEVVVTKGTSGILVLKDSKPFVSGPCIRCGRCIEACPMNLVPAEISLVVEAQAEARYEGVYTLDCIECGCCAFACPAKRPIVHQVKLAKAVIQKQRAEAKADAEKAKAAAAPTVPAK